MAWMYDMYEKNIRISECVLCMLCMILEFMYVGEIMGRTEIDVC